MQFTWDKSKARANERDHGISFETAQRVFLDPFHLVAENYFIDDEQRMIAIGMVDGRILVSLVFVDRSEADTMIIRIISARKATAYEEVLYNAQG